MQDYLAVLAGVLCAGLGGELFVRSAIGLARALRVSAGVVASTVAAFATSSPELAVAISASISQNPQIALGDALGSNVVNIALILGIAVVIAPIHGSRYALRRDFPVALAVPVLTAAFVLDGAISRAEAGVMMVIFLAWLGATVMQARRERAEEEQPSAPGAWSASGLGILGLVFLLAAGHLIVTGATGIAESLGLSAFVIGATVVAVGTSVPELATAVIAQVRGHGDVGLGTLIGSNILNGLWIVPVAALIFPIEVQWREVAVALGFGLAAVLAGFPPRSGRLERGRGVILLLVYGAYLGAVLASR
jgi:cation:H+ antiporter